MKWLAAGVGMTIVDNGFAEPRSVATDEERVPWALRGESLSLATYRRPGTGAAVLYVHGATFPTSMSVGWRMAGMSWFDHLHSAGFDAWSFDFAGYGRSDRPSVFQRAATDAPPFGRAPDAAMQVVRVAEHIRRLRPSAPLHLLAHSWGTLPAQLAAIARPDLIARLVLFGPVAPRQGHAQDATHPAWELVSSDVQRPRQRTGLPAHQPTLVSPEEIERWCSAYQRTDPASSSRSPPSVKVPGGPGADIAAMWSGRPVVESRNVKQPTLIVRGEWDHVTTDADACVLFDSLGAADKRDIKTSGGNHWLHLQPRRTALWQSATSFLSEEPSA
jgi:pimeloyl-ACP methyl ester carboxylesterase